MIGIILQYTLVILLYYFLYKISRMIYLDLKMPVAAAEERTSEPFAEYKPERARLVVEGSKDSLSQTSYAIEETLTIGRTEHNDIIIQDGFASHEHACVTKIKKNYWLYDLNSTNGTFRNGRRIMTEEELQEGDMIQIGTVTFKFER